MLDQTRDQMATKPICFAETGAPEQRHIVANRPARAEVNLLGIAIQKLRNLLSCFFHSFLRLTPNSMNRTRVAPIVAKIRSHRFDDFLANFGGSAIVEINSHVSGLLS